jgi:PQQ-dependent catabolism-associated CXXCW motif protein
MLLSSGAFAAGGDRLSAQQATPSEFVAQAGGWNAKANFDSNGQLTGCAARRPSDASGVWFGILMSRDETWAIAFELPSRELELDKPTPIDITFDGRAQYHLFGLAVDRHRLAIRMQAGAVADQFRKSQSLSVFMQGQYLSFSLAGTSKLLPALITCVRTNGTLAKPPDETLFATRPGIFHYGNEEVDYKIPPQETLKDDVGAATPLTAPGAPTVTTTGLMDAMLNGRPMVLIDALQDRHLETIKGAVPLPYAGAYGTFHDQVQARLANALNRLLLGREGASLVFFCEGVRCWESYNAVLRARAAGFRNIAWYRGGLSAWKAASFPLQPTPTDETAAKPADAALASPTPTDLTLAKPPDAAPVPPQPTQTDATLAKPADAAPVPPPPNPTDATPANPPPAPPVAALGKAPDEAPFATRPPAVFYGNEDFDFKVRPQNTLKRDVGTRTPLTVPGVATVTTTELLDAMQRGRPMVLIDALQDDHEDTIKGAVWLPYAGAYGAGNFHDQVQPRLARTLSGLVQGRPGVPLVFFCQGVRCWESYNAALRARAAGFRNVSWYRGGLHAWRQAGFPVEPKPDASN